MVDERRRLEGVYDHYRDDPATRERWSQANPGNRAVVAERSREVDRLLDRWRPAGSGRLTVLDLGCGARSIVSPRIDDRSVAGPVRLGLDLLHERTVDAARSGQFDGVVCADGSLLPVADASVDLVPVFTVFSSILDDGICRRIGAEVIRVLRPGGAVLWYDVRVRNPANPNLRAMPRPLVEGFFPGLARTWTRVTLLPPLARRLGPLTPVLYPTLRALPQLRSHHLGLFVKPGRTDG